MAATVDILTLGFCSWDYLGIVPRFPLREKARILEYLEQGGGPAATAAVAAVRLGASVGFLGKVGNDLRGDLILDELRKEGVDVSECLRQAAAVSAAGYCWVEQASGSRSIAWHAGSARPLVPEELPAALVQNARILHLDGNHAEAAEAAARMARQAGATVSLDAGTYGPHMLRLVELSHVVIASESFARDLIGRDDPEGAVREMARCGPRIAIVTQGSRGSVCGYEGRRSRHSAFPVPVVDTTGAGDVFHGAFCVGLLEGWEVGACIGFASAAAALKCARLGGRTAIPRRAEVLAFLSSSGGREWRSYASDTLVSPA